MIIFFDLDETLINQKKAEVVAATHFLAAYGRLLPVPYTVAEFCHHWRALREKHAPAFLAGSVSFHEQRRRRVRELFAAAEPHLSDDEADARLAVYLEHYRKNWSLFDDVLPCLDSLTRHTPGVISNGNAEQQLRKLKHTRILHRFPVVVISEEVGVAKPHPEIFLAACRNAGRPPEECVYVGDRLDLDARAARAAGLRGVWLNRGHGREADDVETIHSLAELKGLLAASGRLQGACRP